MATTDTAQEDVLEINTDQDAAEKLSREELLASAQEIYDQACVIYDAALAQSGEVSDEIAAQREKASNLLETAKAAGRGQALPAGFSKSLASMSTQLGITQANLTTVVASKASAEKLVVANMLSADAQSRDRLLAYFETERGHQLWSAWNSTPKDIRDRVIQNTNNAASELDAIIARADSPVREELMAMRGRGVFASSEGQALIKQWAAQQDLTMDDIEEGKKKLERFNAQLAQEVDQVLDERKTDTSIGTAEIGKEEIDAVGMEEEDILVTLDKLNKNPGAMEATRHNLKELESGKNFFEFSLEEQRNMLALSVGMEAVDHNKFTAMVMASKLERDKDLDITQEANRTTIAHWNKFAATTGLDDTARAAEGMHILMNSSAAFHGLNAEQKALFTESLKKTTGILDHSQSTFANNWKDVAEKWKNIDASMATVAKAQGEGWEAINAGDDAAAMIAAERFGQASARLARNLGASEKDAENMGKGLGDTLKFTGKQYMAGNTFGKNVVQQTKQLGDMVSAAWRDSEYGVQAQKFTSDMAKAGFAAGGLKGAGLIVDENGDGWLNPREIGKVLRDAGITYKDVAAISFKGDINEKEVTADKLDMALSLAVDYRKDFAGIMGLDTEKALKFIRDRKITLASMDVDDDGHISDAEAKATRDAVKGVATQNDKGFARG